MTSHVRPRVFAGASGDARNPQVDACRRAGVNGSVIRLTRDARSNCGGAEVIDKEQPLLKRKHHDNKENNSQG